MTDAEAVAPVKGQHYDPPRAQPVTVSAQLLAGKRGNASFKVATAAPPAAPRAGEAGTTAMAAAGTSTAATTALVRPDARRRGRRRRRCRPTGPARSRLDDPTIQAYQPTFKQVEWAADQAVQGTLTTPRPANLYGSGLPTYTPQGLFPLPRWPGAGISGAGAAGGADRRSRTCSRPART